MSATRFVAVTLAAVASVASTTGCDKKPAEQQQPSPTPSVVASAAPSASAPPANVPLTMTGSYDAKRGEIRMPSDAPPFLHPEVKEGTGPGTLTLTLPGAPGPVTGSATGALGEQTLVGWLAEDGRLTATLSPAKGTSVTMWGTVDAKVEGEGAARKVTGTIRASDVDGRVVREASFQLEPEKK